MTVEDVRIPGPLLLFIDAGAYCQAVSLINGGGIKIAYLITAYVRRSAELIEDGIYVQN